MGVAILSALNVWAVNAQTYTDPNSLPESFKWEMVRYDYRGSELVNIQDDIVVTWERDSYWTSTSSNPHVDHYGKLTISNFYRTECTKVESVTLVFENKQNRNFQWNEADSTIVFSFTSYNWSTSKDESPYTTYVGYKSGHKYAFITSLINGGSKPMTWWEDGTTSPVAYGNGTARDCVIDLKDKTITISNKWGCIMMKSVNGGSSTLVEYFDSSIFREPDPTTLAWIEENGVANAAYTVADQLVGVYAQGGSLWCKDQGNISIEKSENPGCIDYLKRLMGSVHGMDPSLEWDQSNWVELDFGDVTAERAMQIQETYVGHTIAAGTITGTYADNLNHRIIVSADPEVDGVADYVPNYYCPVNFMDETVITTDNNSYYFLNPKTQEYAMLTMAMWKGGDVFVIPAKDETQGVNTADFSGAFTVNWDLNAIPEAEIKPLLSTDEVYEFHAILRLNLVETGQDGTLNVNRVIGKDVTPIDKYLVFPIDLTANNTITGINDVKTESQPTGDGFYYNLAGQRVTNPTPGFYIHNGKKVIIR